MSRILTNSIHPRSGNQISIGRAGDTVSIAGTLTYEDVTNIDSVGVITGRSDVHVGAGLSVVGVTTASSGVHYGIVGSGVTIDAVGAGTSLGFLINGSERLRIDSSGRLLVGTTSDTSAARAVIQGLSSDVDAQGVLDIRRGTRPDGSSDTEIGSIRFKAVTGDGRYAQISAFSDGASGSDSDTPGSLRFSTTADSSSSATERMRIDSDGRLLVGTSSASGDALLQVNGGYNILKGFNRRPPLHRGPLFSKTSATAISVVANSALNGYFYSSATAVTMPGSFTNNTDYAIWQHPSDGTLVADASFTTAPTGAAGGSIVGGFHYIPSGRPTAFNNGSPTASAEILEYSIWDLTWRPSCPDPRGMACIEGGFWMDLYLCGATSYAGSTFSAVPSSRIGLTIADGLSPPLVPAQYGGNGSTAYANGKWFTFTEVAASFGKRLPRWQEFSAAAFGAPEASARGSDAGTVQWERVSKFGLAQATGVMFQWGQETCIAETPTGWTTGTETDSRGQVYGSTTIAIVLGGPWYFPADSGSRCAGWIAPPWQSSFPFAARFCCDHIVNG